MTISEWKNIGIEREYDKFFGIKWPDEIKGTLSYQEPEIGFILKRFQEIEKKIWWGGFIRGILAGTILCFLASLLSFIVYKLIS